MTPRTSSKPSPSHHASLAATLAAHRIDALLRAVQCIAHHEDALCSLLHEVRGSDELSGELAGDLQAILDSLPADDYLHDLRLLGELVDRRGGFASEASSGDRTAKKEKAKMRGPRQRRPAAGEGKLRRTSSK